MKKQILFTSFIILLILQSYSQKALVISENKSERISFINTVSLDNIQNVKINTTAGVFTKIMVEGYGHSLEIGKPELPVLKKIIRVPLNADFEIQITKIESKEYKIKSLGFDFPIMPCQYSVSKSDDPAKIPFEFDREFYNSGNYTDYEKIKVEDIGIMRGIRIARLEISPFQYNPVKESIIITSRIEFNIVFKNADFVATEKLYADKYSPYFEAPYSQAFNYEKYEIKDALSKFPIKYVIVSDPSFKTALEPFVEWKTKKGFTVIEAYTDDPLVGSTRTSIQSYLYGLYTAGTTEDPAPSFVLFVGDVAQIPAFDCGGHVSDLYYCEYTGDEIPEVYYGRFSANNITQLQPQIDKTLEYEQYLMPDKAFLDEVVMVSGVDATFASLHGNGQINYGTAEYFNLSNGLTSHTYLYPASGSSASQIIQNVSDGCSFANYTAHGSSSGWSDPAFEISDISSLSNNHKYPLMVGNCCLTSTFDNSECFAEAILRAQDKGAIGYIGASNSSYWDEDYYFSVGYRSSVVVNPDYDAEAPGFYDLLFHTHSEPFSQWYATQAQIIYAGNLAVTQSGSNVQYYWEIYHLMGDPSLMVYLGEPQAITATYSSLIPVGTTSFSIQTVPYGYAAVSMGGILYGAALADSYGNVTVPLSGITTPGTADVVITRQNYAPYFGTVNVDNPTGPYVLYLSKEIHDTSSNNNSLAEYNEKIDIDITLHNYGSVIASGVSASLSANCNYITITDSLETWGNINIAEDITRTYAYSVTLDDDIPDQTSIPFTLKIKDNLSNTWVSNFNIIAFSPELKIENIFVADTISGNGDGSPDPGETIVILIETLNNGHSDAIMTNSVLTSTSSFVTINNSTCNLGTLEIDSLEYGIFSVSIDNDTPDTVLIDFCYTVTSGGFTEYSYFSIPVGAVKEDWESGDFLELSWQNSGDEPWFITTNQPYEGTYCSQSGDINENESSTLSVVMDVASDDSISFMVKVSCEEGYSYGGEYYWYDYLEFLTDGVSVEKWCGEKPWTIYTHPVGSGQHTFTWTYQKDYAQSSGSDCGWLDNILFPPVIIQSQIDIDENVNSGECMLGFYPNPAKGMVTVNFSVDENAETRLFISDISGRLIKYFIEGKTMSDGIYTFIFNSSVFSPGMYILTLQSGNNIMNKKIIIY